MPIRVRLMLLAMVAALVAALLSTAFSIGREVETYAQAKRVEIEAVAAVFASLSAEAARDRDPQAAYRVLRAMARLPDILHVQMLDAGGRLIADQGFVARHDRDIASDGTQSEQSALEILLRGSVKVGAPIVLGGVPVGRFELVADTSKLRQRVADSVQDAALATLLALLLGLGAAHFVQKGLSRRITALAAAMGRIGRTHDYTANLKDSTPDEIGVLIDGFNTMMGDIRARDAALQRHRDHLEQEVANRTSDLAAARDAADEANAAKSRFLATMSHEIRTPMNGMLVMAELLAGTSLDQRQRRFADVIVTSGNSLLAIINDILDVSKIEAGKIELEAIPLDLAQTLDNVTQLFAAKAQAKGLDLASMVDPALGEVIGDPVRLGQVVSNLVNNALKFTESGHVLVSAAPDATRPGHILFTVADTGIGIPADKLGSIFESFSQADETTTRRYGGTGLGLAICQRLVHLMGGEIAAHSESGAGTEFAVELPLPLFDTEPAAVPRLRPAGRPPLVATGRQRHPA
jgi:signal transduction histidine kinase